MNGHRRRNRDEESETVSFLDDLPRDRSLASRRRCCRERNEEAIAFGLLVLSARHGLVFGGHRFEQAVGLVRFDNHQLRWCRMRWKRLEEAEGIVLYHASRRIEKPVTRLVFRRPRGAIKQSKGLRAVRIARSIERDPPGTGVSDEIELLLECILTGLGGQTQVPETNLISPWIGFSVHRQRTQALQVVDEMGDPIPGSRGGRRNELDVEDANSRRRYGRRNRGGSAAVTGGATGTSPPADKRRSRCRNASATAPSTAPCP